MIKAVIFDADGMVINAELFSNRLSREYNIPLGKILTLFEKDYPLCAVGQADLKEVLKKYVKDWSWPGTVEELLRYWFKTEHKVDGRIIRMIEKLRQKGIKCYLATNQENYRLSYISNEMGLNKVFDKVFASCRIGHNKSSQEFFEAVLGELSGLRKEDVLYFDDREENVRTARKFGFQAEVYRDFEGFSETLERFKLKLSV
jgi:putative hydrolase of the HAD superfamily